MWLEHVLIHESLLHDNLGKNEGEGYKRYEKNAPAEQHDERKVCGTQKNSQRQNRVEETEKSWNS